MNKRFERFFGLKSKLKKVKNFFGGTLSFPFLCLGIISVILFSFVSLGADFIFKSLDDQGDFSFTTISKTVDKALNPAVRTQENLFVGPNKNFRPESPDFILVENSAIRAVSPPTTFSPQVLGALVGGYETEDIKRVVVEYIIEQGDILGSIAAKFDITLNTLLWANDLNENSVIQPGQKLIILPVSGVIHHIKAGDTISEIAKKYKGKIDEIIAFNGFSNEGDIYIGDIVIVPNGVMPASFVQPQAPAQTPLASSYFITPVLSPYIITQGLHWYNALDFSHEGNACGKPILAVAGGQVLKVKLTNLTSRWAFGGAGNHLTILHPNGVVTLYGHIAASLVNPGDQVSQGQIIAYMGGQPGTPGAGMSTGCHLHFGVSGARNPFAR